MPAADAKTLLYGPDAATAFWAKPKDQQIKQLTALDPSLKDEPAAAWDDVLTRARSKAEQHRVFAGVKDKATTTPAAPPAIRQPVSAAPKAAAPVAPSEKPVTTAPPSVAAPAQLPSKTPPTTRSFWDSPLDPGDAITSAATGLVSAGRSIARGVRSAEGAVGKGYTEITKNKIPHAIEYIKSDKGQQQIADTAKAAAHQVGGAVDFMTSPKGIALTAGMVLAPEVLGTAGAVATRIAGTGLTVAQVGSTVKSLLSAIDNPSPDTIGKTLGDIAILAPLAHGIKSLNGRGLWDVVREKLSGKSGVEAEKVKAAVDQVEKTAPAVSNPGHPAATPPATRARVEPTKPVFPPKPVEKIRVEPPKPLFPPKPKTGQLPTEVRGAVPGKGQLEAELTPTKNPPPTRSAAGLLPSSTEVAQPPAGEPVAQTEPEAPQTDQESERLARYRTEAAEKARQFGQTVDEYQQSEEGQRHLAESLVDDLEKRPTNAPPSESDTPGRAAIKRATRKAVAPKAAADLKAGKTQDTARTFQGKVSSPEERKAFEDKLADLNRQSGGKVTDAIREHLTSESPQDWFEKHAPGSGIDPENIPEVRRAFYDYQNVKQAVAEFNEKHPNPTHRISDWPEDVQTNFRQLTDLMRSTQDRYGELFRKYSKQPERLTYQTAEGTTQVDNPHFKGTKTPPATRKRAVRAIPEKENETTIPAPAAEESSAARPEAAAAASAETGADAAVPAGQARHPNDLTREAYEQNREAWGEHTQMVPTEELGKYREYDRRKEPRDGQEYYDELTGKIRAGGINKPVVMKYNPKTGKTWIADGNHRLAIGEDLGIDKIPVTVKRSNLDDPDFNAAPEEHKSEGREIPEQFAPSHIGFSGEGGAEASGAAPSGELHEPTRSTVEGVIREANQHGIQSIEIANESGKRVTLDLSRSSPEKIQEISRTLGESKKLSVTPVEGGQGLKSWSRAVEAAKEPEPKAPRAEGIPAKDAEAVSTRSFKGLAKGTSMRYTGPSTEEGMHRVEVISGPAAGKTYLFSEPEILEIFGGRQ